MNPAERKRPRPPEYLIQFARELRQDAPDAEQLIWNLVRDRRLDGYKFRRQHPLNRYVLDFYCAELKLAIELDGGQHASRLHADQQRTEYLASLGVEVLRYWNNDVLTRTPEVLTEIWERLQSRAVATLTPAPPPQGGGEHRQ